MKTKIILAIDGSKNSEWAVDFLLNIPLAETPQVRVLRVVPQRKHIPPFLDSVYRKLYKDAIQEKIRAFKKVLIATDGSSYSDAAVTFLKSHFLTKEVIATLLNVWDYPVILPQFAFEAVEENIIELPKNHIVILRKWYWLNSKSRLFHICMQKKLEGCYFFIRIKK